MKKVYCDTCVFLNFINNETNRYGISLADFAQYFFAKVQQGEYVLVYSDWTIYEIKKFTKIERFNEIIDMLENTEYIKIIKEDKENAQKHKNFDDAVHAYVAIRNNIPIITTRDINGFYEFVDKLTIERPESL